MDLGEADLEDVLIHVHGETPEQARFRTGLTGPKERDAILAKVAYRAVTELNTAMGKGPVGARSIHQRCVGCENHAPKGVRTTRRRASQSRFLTAQTVGR